MRDYTRKAKRVDNGEWVKGFYFCMEHKDGRHVHHFIIPLGADLSLGTPIEKIKVEIDPNTICDPTGLTDKNGNKIWENDILRYSYDYENSHWLEAKGLTNKDIKYHIGAVFWQEWRGVWAVCGKGTSRGCNQDVYVYSRNPNRVEVIGNIFDNEDLLKGE